VADSVSQGGEYGVHHGNGRDLLPRWHDCLRKTDERPIREVALFGDDAELREQGVIRVPIRVCGTGSV